MNERLKNPVIRLIKFKTYLNLHWKILLYAHKIIYNEYVGIKTAETQNIFAPIYQTIQVDWCVQTLKWNII